MINILEKIDFGNEAADDIDPIELNKHFVIQKTFNKFLDSKNLILVATGRKV